jgi:hypothetical protein
MTDDDHGERLAVLETEVDMVKGSLAELKTGQAAILAELTKYKGAIGFATFIVSCVLSALMLMKDWIATHIK